MPNKNKARFIKFDIVEVYPSISENLLEKAINYARTITTITKDTVDVVKHGGKSLLFDCQDTWIKKGENQMGSFDGAEICELVGLYLLSQLSNLINQKQIMIFDGLLHICYFFSVGM